MTTILNPDRYLSPNAPTREIAGELYQIVAELPIVSPHGHVDRRLFADPGAQFGTPADLFIIPITTSRACCTRRGFHSSLCSPLPRGAPQGCFAKGFRVTEKLASDDFSPRRLFSRFNIEVLCTTDAATDTLEHHQAIRASGWNGRILPTFRPDGVVNLDAPLEEEHRSARRSQWNRCR